ncbi:MAG: dihydrodipicolinate synthase family protein [Sedimentisphaerales bacterium]|nr:dihydrodipicolinate synthase family protein [Sedimentisphaerales bacterium]
MNNKNTKGRRARATGGVIVPVITPVDENEHVDEKAFRAVIRRCLDAGVDGIFAGGSAGMGPLLTDDQWRRAMEIAADEVVDGHVLMGGVIATSTARALRQIRILDRIGFATMVVTPTFYLAPSRESELLAHFEACRQATDMQMVTYNIPGCTGISIPVETIGQMAVEGWTDLVKESSGDRDYFARVLAACRPHGVGVMQGNEPDIEWGLTQGAAGIVPVCANYEPQTYVCAFEAAQRQNPELLARAQRRASAIRDVLGVSRRNWIAGIMYGVSTLGIGSGKPILPLQGLTPAEKAPVDELEVIDIRSSANGV